jgi:hypothetical protein
MLGCTEDVSEEDLPQTENTGELAPASPPAAGELEVLLPVNGARIVGSLVEAVGTSAHLAGLRSEGESIPLGEDGGWSAELARDPGLRIIEFRGDSLRGTTLKEERLVLVGDGRVPDDPVPAGLVFFVSKTGMGSLANSIAVQIDPEEVESEIKKSGSLYRKSIGFIGLARASIEVKLKSLDFQSVDATLTPRQDKLELEIQLNQLNVQTSIEIRIGPTTTNASARMLSDPAIIRCEVVPRLQGGTLRVDVKNTEVKLKNFKPKLSGIPMGLEPESIRTDIRKALETELAKGLEADLPAQVNPFLAELNQKLRVPLGHEQITIQIQPSAVRIDEDGAELSLSQTIQGVYPDDAMPVLALSGTAPSATEGTSATLSLADDLPNRVLHEAWHRGLFELVLSTASGELDARILEALEAKEITIRAHPLLPPVVVGTQDGIQLQAGPVHTVVTTPDGNYGTRMELEISAWVDLEATILDGDIRVRMSDLETRIILLDHDWSLPEAMVLLAVRKSMDLENRIEDALDRTVIPIPSIPGLDVEPVSIDRDPHHGYSRGALQLKHSD